MGGLAFPSKGSAGVAPVVQWFGYVPDQFCCLSRAAINQGSVIQKYVDQQNGSFANLWVIYNQAQLAGPNAVTASFTTNTTAPDGTTNVAQKMVEAATTTPHGVVATFTTSSGPRIGHSEDPTFKLRLSGFFKAAERTRVALVMGNGQFDSGLGSHFNGCITVFDLAGGQIGVANTASNAPGDATGWATGPTEIVPFGNGWFRCSMDASVGTNSGGSGYGFAIIIDAGSGTGAMNINYAGNGSGIYTWKTTCLPPAAWGISSSVFFDDFLSASTVDLAQTNAPGFNWYLTTANAWLGAGSWLNMNPSHISIANSLLTIAPISPDGFTFVDSIAPVGGGSGYTGHVFVNPFLLEFSYAYDTSLLPSNEVSLFGVSTEYLTSSVNTSTGMEYDFWQGCPFANSDLPNGNYQTSFGVSGFALTNPISWGVPKWNATLPFQNGQIVDFNGVTYKSQVSSNTGNQPDISPGQWTAYTSTFYQSGVIPQIDYSQQHKRSILFLPFIPNDSGQSMTFLDGFFCMANDGVGGFGSGSHFTWNPAMVSGNQMLRVGDKAHFPLMLSADRNRQMQWDWVRVSQ